MGFTAALVFAASSSALARTWTEASSGRTLEGDFVRQNGDQVVIRRANGSTIQVQMARLSEADQNFLKEQAEAATAPMERKSSPPGDSAAPLVGTWEGIMADRDGSRHGDIRLVITESEITAFNPRSQQLMGAGTYRVTGEVGDLHRIDAEGTSGQFQGKKYEGIFQIDGKTLKWCSANDNPNSARPEKLQTDPPSGHFLMVLEKKE